MSAHLPQRRRRRSSTAARTTSRRTMLIPRDPALRLAPRRSRCAPTPLRRGRTRAARCSRRRSPGEVISLDRAQHHDRRRRGRHRAGDQARRGVFPRAAFRQPGAAPEPRELPPGTHPIAPQDVIDVGGWSFEVITPKARENTPMAGWTGFGAKRTQPRPRACWSRSPRRSTSASPLPPSELARSQLLLRDASAQLMTAFRGAADRIVAAQQAPPPGAEDRNAEYGVVLDHLYGAVHHLQSHDLVNQLIDAQKLRVDKMREKLERGARARGPPDSRARAGRSSGSSARAPCSTASSPASARSTTTRAPRSRTDKQHAGSVDLF